MQPLFHLRTQQATIDGGRTIVGTHEPTQLTVWVRVDARGLTKAQNIAIAALEAGLKEIQKQEIW